MKKKALILLLIIPFFISILAFVTSSFVIRGVEVDIISISFDEYSANQAFLLSEEEVKLKVNVNKDPNYPLSEGNDLVFSSSNDDIASIDIRDDGAYLILHEEGETLITCSNEKGNKSASFNAIVLLSNSSSFLFWADVYMLYAPIASNKSMATIVRVTNAIFLSLFISFFLIIWEQTWNSKFKIADF